MAWRSMIAMQIGEGEQYGRDFDWYCVDAQDRIGHFTTAGFKRLPRSVALSSEALAYLDDFFNALKSTVNGHELNDHLTPERRTERYLHSFVAMADRGLYSFDIEAYGAPDLSYFRVAIPKKPLCLSDCPDRVIDVLSRTILSAYPLERSAEIPYTATLEI